MYHTLKKIPYRYREKEKREQECFNLNNYIAVRQISVIDGCQASNYTSIKYLIFFITITASLQVSENTTEYFPLETSRHNDRHCEKLVDPSRFASSSLRVRFFQRVCLNIIHERACCRSRLLRDTLSSICCTDPIICHLTSSFMTSMIMPRIE